MYGRCVCRHCLSPYALKFTFCDFIKQEVVLENMHIVCNGEQREIISDMTVRELVESLGLNADTIAVLCDGKVLMREEYNNQVLTEGVEVELIKYVGGGALC